MDRFVVKVQHSPDTIRRLSSVQYAVTNRVRRIIAVMTAIVCLLLGTRLLGEIPEPLNYAFSLYGCFVLVFMNVPSKWRADKVISQITRSGAKYPCTVFHFGDGKELTVTSQGSHSPCEHYAYSDCRQILEDRGDLFYFVSEDAAFLFPKSSIPEDPAFKAFLQEKTGLEICPVPHWWNFSLKHLIKSVQNARRK